MSTQPFLELHNIHHSFQDGDAVNNVLRGVNLQVPAGRMIAIMGPSGAGKSTLLKIAGGLLVPTGGDVILEGKALRSRTEADLAQYRRRFIGFVFQEYNLINNLTARENVALPLELDGIARNETLRLADEALAKTGVTDVAQRWAGDLSGGQAQRVAVARAIVRPGRMLLADEPTGALDSVASDQMMALLRERVDEGTTCLMVTHDARLASWADEILYLRDGVFVKQNEMGAPLSLSTIFQEDEAKVNLADETVIAGNDEDQNQGSQEMYAANGIAEGRDNSGTKVSADGHVSADADESGEVR